MNAAPPVKPKDGSSPVRGNEKQARAALVACCGVHALHDGLTDLLYVLLPVLAQAFGLSYSQVGLVRAVNKGAMATLQLPAGLLSEKLGERKLLAFGTACAGISYIWLGAAPGFYSILIALFFAGAGASFQHPLSSSIISGAYPAEGRRIALGTYNFAGDVGKVTVSGGTGMILAAGFAWQMPAIGLGILAGICAALIVILLKDVRGPEPQQRTDRTDGKSWGIRNRKGFVALCLFEVIDGGTRSGFLTFVAFLMLERGIEQGWAVISVPMVAVGGMAGKIACGYLAERLGVIRTLVATEVATGAGILLTLVLPPFAAYLLLPLIGVALNGTSSVLYGTVGDLVDPKRMSRAFGLFYTLGSACGVVAPLAYGTLADKIGILPTVAVVGSVVLTALPLCIVLRQAVSCVKPAESQQNNRAH
jgi:MFS family permease